MTLNFAVLVNGRSVANPGYLVEWGFPINKQFKEKSLIHHLLY